MSADEIAAAFVQHYYQSLDSNVASLAGLFVGRFMLHPRHLSELNGHLSHSNLLSFYLAVR
jgi:hypothetical protein